MENVCTGCGSTELVSNENCGELQCVCRNCGLINSSSTSYVNELHPFDHTTRCHAGGTYNPCVGRAVGYIKRDEHGPNRSHHFWLKYVRVMCSELGLNYEMQKGTCDLFSQSYRRKELRYKHQLQKRALCGCCIFIVCRRLNWPILLSDIGFVACTPVRTLNTVLKVLKVLFNIKIPGAEMENLVKSVLMKNNMHDARHTEITMKIVNLAKEVWLTEGRPHNTIIIAAAYVAWRANIRDKRLQLMARFVEEFKITLPPQTHRRLNEIFNVLMMLVAKLPWLPRKKPTRKIVLQNLEDILKYKRSLLSQVTPPAIDDNVQDDTKPACSYPPCFTKKRKVSDLHESSIERSSSWNGKEVSLDKELTESDIPEDEMHIYLRSESEVQQLQKTLDSDQN